jgi:hypothetical protein
VAPFFLSGAAAPALPCARLKQRDFQLPHKYQPTRHLLHLAEMPDRNTMAESARAMRRMPEGRTALRTRLRESRDALLTAIVKAREWIDDIRLGQIAGFAEIAKREAQGERHIRLLAPLAFASPRIIAAILDGSAPADLTVTALAKALPHSWAEQEQSVGLPQ